MAEDIISTEKAIKDARKKSFKPAYKIFKEV